MDKKNYMGDRSTWAIGGSVMIGVGIGFFFLKQSALAFIACIIIGTGAGLVIASIISRK